MKWQARVFLWGPEIRPEWAESGFFTKAREIFQTGRYPDSIGRYVGTVQVLQDWLDAFEDCEWSVQIENYWSERLR